jgi:hypothetical protein
VGQEKRVGGERSFHVLHQQSVWVQRPNLGEAAHGLVSRVAALHGDAAANVVGRGLVGAVSVHGRKGLERLSSSVVVAAAAAIGTPWAADAKPRERDNGQPALVAPVSRQLSFCNSHHEVAMGGPTLERESSEQFHHKCVAFAVVAATIIAISLMPIIRS